MMTDAYTVAEMVACSVDETVSLLDVKKAAKMDALLAETMVDRSAEIRVDLLERCSVSFLVASKAAELVETMADPKDDYLVDGMAYKWVLNSADHWEDTLVGVKVVEWAATLAAALVGRKDVKMVVVTVLSWDAYEVDKTAAWLESRLVHDLEILVAGKRDDESAVLTVEE